ncbi:hypothetical protein ACFLT8_00785 [Chloroflexota bacterium]
MNIFSYIIIATLFFEFLLDTFNGVLNLRALKQEIPAVLTGIYKPVDYRKSQEYTRLLILFGFVTGSFGLLVILLFWLTGGFNFLDRIVGSWGFGAVVSGLCYLGILLLVYELLMIPFSVYTTFVIEERFEPSMTKILRTS